MNQKRKKTAKTKELSKKIDKKQPKPKKEKKQKEIIEDHSDYKVEIWPDPKTKFVYTFDWQGNMK